MKHQNHKHYLNYKYSNIRNHQKADIKNIYDGVLVISIRHIYGNLTQINPIRYFLLSLL